MSKTVAIIQSNYIPWKGYFDIINSVDEFVLFDDVQYTRRDWRNRNKIKTPAGLKWLTIPVEVKGKFFQKIRETRIADDKWVKDHWNSIIHSYSKAACFAKYSQQFEKLYEDAGSLELLSDVNFLFIKAVCDVLEIETKLVWSSEFELKDDKTERLLSICQQTGATTYVSGAAAKGYLDVNAFEKEGINVHWFEYEGYPEYSQMHPPFDHYVSILDLIFNVGEDASKYMLSFGRVANAI